MKIPYLVGIGIAIIGLIAIVGLSQSAVDDSQNKIRVAFFPSIVHAVPIVGMENQTFADNLDGDMNIEVKIFDSGPQVIESIFSNSVDLAYVGPGPVINGFLKSDGKDLKILGSAANGGASFIIQKNSGLESIENYSGKRVAAPQISNTQDVSLRHYLYENGLKPAEKGGDVFVLDMGQPIKIFELAKRMINLSGLSVRDENNRSGDIEIQITGLRSGEKLYEELLIENNPEKTDHP